MAATTQVQLLVWTFLRTLSFGVAAVGANFHPACTHPTCTPSKRTGICTNSRKCERTAIESCPVIWVHSSVVRAADCRSAGPWFKSGCALLSASPRFGLPAVRKRAVQDQSPFSPNAWMHSEAKENDPGRTRTCNLWFRRPTPYPLGHRANWKNE